MFVPNLKLGREHQVRIYLYVDSMSIKDAGLRDVKRNVSFGEDGNEHMGFIESGQLLNH